MPKSSPGERNPRAKLTTQDVLDIRESRESCPILAKRYGVTEGTIGDIRCFRSWSHIPPRPRRDEPGEEWRPVVGYEDRYEVSNLGRVRSLFSRTGMIRKTKTNRFGYVILILVKDNRQRVKFLHRVVTEVFIGPMPQGHQVNHLNGIKTDNRLENLEYVTPKQNKVHAAGMGMTARGERNCKARLTEAQVREIRQRNETERQAAERYGVHLSTIARIRQRKAWTHVP